MSDKHVIRYLDITDQPQTLPPALKIFDLTGKVAVVTGASSGLGKEMAKGLAMGLEFKMGSEILRTVVVREWKEIGIVAGIIALRAALTFLIHWEIKEEERAE